MGYCKTLKIILTIFQPHVLSCYVLQRVQPIKLQKPFLQPYSIQDHYVRNNETFKTLAFCNQKQASTIAQL